MKCVQSYGSSLFQGDNGLIYKAQVTKRFDGYKNYVNYRHIIVEFDTIIHIIIKPYKGISIMYIRWCVWGLVCHFFSFLFFQLAPMLVNFFLSLPLERESQSR